jgi:transcription initiation factor IIE alpha subunit
MKVDILSVLAERGEAEATEVAWALGVGYETAAMALLRAYRGGLVARTGAPGSEPFRYALTDKGAQRLDYLRAGGHPDRHAVHYSPTKVRGDDDMRSKKLHSGLYHCPECLYEVTLTAEASLRCEDCKGRLYEGELPDEDSYDDGAEG